MIIKEVPTLVNKSSSKETILIEVRETTKNKKNKTIRAFSPTQWTIHRETCASIFNNHEDLMRLWKWSLCNMKDTEMKARIIPTCQGHPEDLSGKRLDVLRTSPYGPICNPKGRNRSGTSLGRTQNVN